MALKWKLERDCRVHPGLFLPQQAETERGQVGSYPGPREVGLHPFIPHTCAHVNAHTHSHRALPWARHCAKCQRFKQIFGPVHALEELTGQRGKQVMVMTAQCDLCCAGYLVPPAGTEEQSGEAWYWPSVDGREDGEAGQQPGPTHERPHGQRRLQGLDFVLRAVGDNRGVLIRTVTSLNLCQSCPEK